MIHRLACVSVLLGFWVLSAQAALAQPAEPGQWPESDPSDEQASAIEAAEEAADDES